MCTTVSAIITTHRRQAKVVKRALESVLNQTYPPCEILVINDCPEYENNPEIETLMDSYLGKVKYFYNTDRRGANGSRNIGIEKSRGTVIAFLDDDDEWEANHLKAMVPFISNKVGFVYGNKSVYKDGYVVPPKKKECHFDGEVFNKLVECGNFVGGCSLPIFKKEIVVQAGMFDEKMLACQDLDCWIRMARLCEFKYVDEIVTRYHISQDAITSYPYKRITGWQQIMKKNEALYENNRSARRWVKNNIVLVELTYGNFGEALKTYLEEYDNMADRLKNCRVLVKGCTKYILRNLKIISR